MKYIAVTILAWILTKILYNYTALGRILNNIPIGQLYIKTIICILIVSIYFLGTKLIKKI